MKINLTVENAEFAFIKHAVQKQSKQLVEYFDAMHKVATYMVETPKESLDVEQQFEEYLKDEFVKKEPAKRRGRPPLNKTTRGTRK
jgi:hypothetical protein